MRSYMRALTILILLALVLSACAAPPGSEAGVTPTPVRTLNVMVHDSFMVSENVIRQFEQRYHARVNFVRGGDAGTLLNRAILYKDSPEADVLYGIDNAFLSRALEADLFEPYNAVELEFIRDEFKLDPQWRLLPVDYGDVCLNYDKAYFAERSLPVPQSLDDLVKPEYKGLLVVENPAISSPGLIFLLATVARFGPDGYLDYWKALRANDVVVVNDWTTAYSTNFSGSSGKGPQPLVVSYNTSPIAELIFATELLSEPPTGAITAPQTCFRQVEFVGILKGAKDLELARLFVEFMLGPDFQQDMPKQMFVMPVNKSAPVPSEFTTYMAAPEQLLTLDLAQISANREDWIKAWDEVVLR
jgi:thiamine transport system substrate-binding protein